MSKSTYYHICEYCGEVLDPGERCTCRNNAVREPEPQPNRSGASNTSAGSNTTDNTKNAERWR